MIHFLHTPKTAGNSLSEIANETIKIHGHRIKTKIPKPSFCFTRNPYDRLVSAYFYLIDESRDKEPDISYRELLLKYNDFKAFVMNIEKDRLNKAIIHLKPMSYYIDDIDKIFKIEEPNKINNYLLSLGISKKINDVRVNRSSHKHYLEYLDADIIKEVNRIYKEDFERFNYKML